MNKPTPLIGDRIIRRVLAPVNPEQASNPKRVARRHLMAAHAATGKPVSGRQWVRVRKAARKAARPT